MSAGLMRHELAHALAGILAIPGTIATVTDHGSYWQTTHAWPVKDPGEWCVVVSHVAGFVLAPDCASDEDRMFYAVLPRALRDKAVAFCWDAVAPALAEFSTADLADMAVTVERDGGIQVSRVIAH